MKKPKKNNKVKEYDIVDGLNSVLVLLRSMHDALKMGLITKDEFKEEVENISDFMSANKELPFLIEKVEVVDCVDEVIGALIDLHINFCNHIWHIEQIQELAKRMLEHYQKDKKIIVNESGKVAES